MTAVIILGINEGEMKTNPIIPKKYKAIQNTSIQLRTLII